MKQLLRETHAYGRIAADARAGRQAQAMLVLFPDGAHLRALLKECAKAFFAAEDGSRVTQVQDYSEPFDTAFYSALDAKMLKVTAAISNGEEEQA